MPITQKELKDRKIVIAYQRFYLIVKDALKNLDNKLNEYYKKEKKIE